MKSLQRLFQNPPAGQFFSLSSIGWRRGPGRGGAFSFGNSPLLNPLPTRSSRGEEGAAWVLKEPHALSLLPDRENGFARAMKEDRIHEPRHRHHEAIPKLDLMDGRKVLSQ